MVVRQLKPEQFHYLRKELIKKAVSEPMEASYKVSMSINGREYVLKVQPDKRCNLVALQALQVDRRDCEPFYVLITDGRILSSLLELMIFQGVE